MKGRGEVGLFSMHREPHSMPTMAPAMIAILDDVTVTWKSFSRSSIANGVAHAGTGIGGLRMKEYTFL
jgi:hypothetical protein